MILKAVISDKEAFLAHHGTKGMKWGVHNDETKLKYGEIDHLPGAGGGGGDDEDEKKKTDSSNPEEMLKRGEIDAATAKKIRADYDKLIERTENGEFSHLSDAEREALFKKARDKHLKAAGYLAADGSARWKESDLQSSAKRSKADRISDAREMARDWGPDGVKGIQTAVKNTIAVEKRAKKNDSKMPKDLEDAIVSNAKHSINKKVKAALKSSKKQTSETSQKKHDWQMSVKELAERDQQRHLQ